MTATIRGDAVVMENKSQIRFITVLGITVISQKERVQTGANAANAPIDSVFHLDQLIIRHHLSWNHP